MQIDEPKFRFSIRQNYLPNVQGFYYMRLHGRNAARWWRHDEVRRPLRLPVLGGRTEGVHRHRVRGRATLVRKPYLYTNNHFSAKSVANAAMIKQQLGEPIEGEYPPEFLARFPIWRGWSTSRPASGGCYDRTVNDTRTGRDPSGANHDT